MGVVAKHSRKWRLKDSSSYGSKGGRIARVPLPGGRARSRCDGRRALKGALGKINEGTKLDYEKIASLQCTNLLYTWGECETKWGIDPFSKRTHTALLA